jgi:hypothetical protein
MRRFRALGRIPEARATVSEQPNRGKMVFLVLFLVTLGSMLASTMVLVNR